MGDVTTCRVESDDLGAAVEEDGLERMLCGPSFGELEERLSDVGTANRFVHDQIIDVEVIASGERRHGPHSHNAQYPPVGVERSVQRIADTCLLLDSRLELLETQVAAELSDDRKRCGQVFAAKHANDERR